jgi:hypothetical protein
MATGAVDDRGVDDAYARVINHIFGSGLVLANLATCPGIDAYIARRLCEVIEGLDSAVHELRLASLGRALVWAEESDGLVVAARSGSPFARRVGGMFYAIETRLPLCYEAMHAGAPLAAFSEPSVGASALDEDSA